MPGVNTKIFVAIMTVSFVILAYVSISLAFEKADYVTECSDFWRNQLQEICDKNIEVAMCDTNFRTEQSIPFSFNTSLIKPFPGIPGEP